MKFAVRLSEVIYSHKGVFFISSSGAVNARCVIKHVRRVFVVGRGWGGGGGEGALSFGSDRIETLHHLSLLSLS